MYNDDRSTGAHSRDLVGDEPIETIEDLLRKCGFFDGIIPNQRDDEVLAS